MRTIQSAAGFCPRVPPAVWNRPCWADSLTVGLTHWLTDWTLRLLCLRPDASVREDHGPHEGPGAGGADHLQPHQGRSLQAAGTWSDSTLLWWQSLVMRSLDLQCFFCLFVCCLFVSSWTEPNLASCLPDHHRLRHDIEQVFRQWEALPLVSQWVPATGTPGITRALAGFQFTPPPSKSAHFITIWMALFLNLVLLKMPLNLFLESFRKQWNFLHTNKTFKFSPELYTFVLWI